MRKGEILQDFKVLLDGTTAGAGLCRWSFAEKSGKQYFIKEFLKPTYPVEGFPAPPEVLQRKRQECEAFENHHRSIMQALSGKSSEGGNLVVAREFFRVGPKYYKVTDKVDVSSLSIKEISEIDLTRRILTLRTIAHSLSILHSSKIVHGDLKPENILIRKTTEGSIVAKLIDFDDSYFAGRPPDREILVGTTTFYSPETAQYIQGFTTVKPSELTSKSDIFACGLIFSQYLTGALPVFDRTKYRYAYEVVSDGRKLTIASASLPPRLTELVDSMLLLNFNERPTIQDVFGVLKESDLLSSHASGPSSSKLRGSLTKPSSPSIRRDKGLPSSKGNGLLRGDLLRRKSSSK
jgi:serine/threonine protein kinase